MQIEVKIDPSCQEPKVLVFTDEMKDEIKDILERLNKKDVSEVLAGFQGDMATVLNPDDIFRVYAQGDRVIAVTPEGEYTLRLRLYEVQERLDEKKFVRISHSEIINLRKIKRFDLSLAGTICVVLTNGAVTYVSRRNVARIKKMLGI